MVGIIGSGFGLYGYLPAVIDGLKENVILPLCYRQKFDQRNELKNYAKHISWVDSEKELYSKINTLIIALPPLKQEHIIHDILDYDNIHKLYLEKPLAVDPSNSVKLLNQLSYSGKQYRIGYTFQYTDWALHLSQLMQKGNIQNNISLRWNFCAYHYRKNVNNWKRYHDKGGGAIRFYGIHIIAFFSVLGFRNVIHSESFGENKNDISKRNAVIENSEHRKVNISIDSRTQKQEFIIKQENTSLMSQKADFNYVKSDPFLNVVKDYSEEIDPRVDLLIQYLISKEDVKVYADYDVINKTWSELESKNIYNVDNLLY